MSSRQLDKRHNPEDDRLIARGFLSENPKLAGLPHILVKSGRRTLEIIAAMLRCPLALWGERLLVGLDGRPYLEPTNSKILEDFKMWALDANQQYLLERSNIGPDPGFKMFISANTPVSTLERTYTHFSENTEDVPWFGDYIELVGEWILDLHWALIPLAGEIEWSMFVAAPVAPSPILTLSREFERNQIPIAHLEKNNSHFYWIRGCT